ncbi:MAG TPA: phytanoyl-CoA dioxygenase family protein [Candidatus Saccharimonadia bacterium]|nr:phytanoyl-CoA dioxygenase family protein [Candidatus Saccharimonadia bacterium]
MIALDTRSILEDYERDGVVRVPRLFNREQVDILRAEIERYIREDLQEKPLDARTLEPDGVTVRNLWRMEQHHPEFCRMVESEEIVALAGQLVHGEPLLMAVETFNKPARVGSGVPYHQDNAYFCQAPPDMLTIWIAMDPVTLENGPVYYVRGSHKEGMLPTKPSGVKGNSIGLADAPSVPVSEQFCGLLEPGDALIHQCQTIHHSAPNTSEHPRLGLLLVYRGTHTQTDPQLKAAYSVAATATPPA